jgi:hypothetical protein
LRAVIGAATIVGLSVVEMFWLGQLAERPGDGAAGVRLAADGVNPVELPAFVGTEWIGRRAEVTAVEREILPADTGFSRRSYVQVQGGAHAVFVSIVLSGRDRTSIHRPALCLVGQGWTIRGAEQHRFAWPEENSAAGESGRGSAHGILATVLHTERVEARTRRKIPAVVAYWFVNRDAVVATHWERFCRDAWNRLAHGRADRWAYVLMQADAADGEAAGLARIQEVLGAVGPAFQRVP